MHAELSDLTVRNLDYADHEPSMNSQNSRESSPQDDKKLKTTEFLKKTLIVTRVADVVYADDIQAVGRLGPCLKYYTRPAAVGPKYGYNPNPAKTVFVVPEEYVEAVKEHLQTAAGRTLANANVTSGAQYIGAYRAYVGDEAGTQPSPPPSSIAERTSNGQYVLPLTSMLNLKRSSKTLASQLSQDGPNRSQIQSGLS